MYVCISLLQSTLSLLFSDVAYCFVTMVLHSDISVTELVIVQYSLVLVLVLNLFLVSFSINVSRIHFSFEGEKGRYGRRDTSFFHVEPWSLHCPVIFKWKHSKFALTVVTAIADHAHCHGQINDDYESMMTTWQALRIMWSWFDVLKRFLLKNCLKQLAMQDSCPKQSLQWCFYWVYW